MLEFLSLKPEAFGLDISDLSLKIVKLKKRGKFFTLASFGEKEIPPGVIKAGEIRDEDKLAEIIKQAIKEVKGEKIKTKYVVASLPEEKAFLRVIQMPKMAERDLKSAIIYEAENHIPLPPEDVYLDFQIVPPLFDHLDHFDILIAALPRKIIDPYLSSFNKAGIVPVVLEIESLAIARALIKKGVSHSSLLLIDLGATRTSSIIFSGYSPRFTTYIPVSSQKFTEAISKNLNIDLKKAEKLKIKYGLKKTRQIKLKGKSDNSVFKVESSEDKRIFESLIPSLVDLIEQIKRYISFYQTHAFHEHLSSDGKGIEKILLSGGGANLKGLPEFLSLELKIPVELGNPWINILPESLREIPQLPYQESLKYTTCFGLALRAIEKKYD